MDNQPKNAQVRALEALETLVDEWMTLPDIADAWGVSITEVRRGLEDGEFLGVKRGEPKVLQVPTIMVLPHTIEKLPGTITLLHDAGYSDAEALEWLFTHDDTLPGTPIGHLRDGHRAEIRRRAQALGF